MVIEKKPESIMSLNTGDVVEIVGLTCLENGAIRKINERKDGQRYFFCQEGEHNLDEDTDRSVLNGYVTIEKIK